MDSFAWQYGNNDLCKTYADDKKQIFSRKSQIDVQLFQTFVKLIAIHWPRVCV